MESADRDGRSPRAETAGAGSWRRAAFPLLTCTVFLAGVQLLLPLSRLRADRPVGFGWHMYAHGPDRVRFVVEGPAGTSTPIEDYELFARRRPELRPERWAPEYLCERVPDARSVRIVFDDRPAMEHRCGD